MPLVSIIIRTKNEERWIGRCLQMVYRQTLSDHEVIIVDNQSNDHTLEISRKYPVRILSIDKFKPGAAINLGITAATGKFIAVLSAHCIPKDEYWLEALVRNMEHERVAGVYGRQLPFAYSSDLDKRDLLITFGLDHRIQIKDSFFHNANSLIRRDVWSQIPFDADASNIEDRIWGQAVIEAGYQIAYEPEASVFHYHGIHQNRDEGRARNIVRIMESLEGLSSSESIPLGFRPETMNILGILPVLGDIAKLADTNLLERSIQHAKSSMHIKKLALISENKEALALASAHNFVPIERPLALMQPQISVEEVLQYALKYVERGNEHFDAVLYMNYLYPFRPRDFFDELIVKFAQTGVDSLVPTLKDFQPHWVESEGKVVRCDIGLMPSEFKVPMQKGALGVGTITSSEFVRKGCLLGDNIALISLQEPLYGMKAGEPFSQGVIEHALKYGVCEFGVTQL